MKSLAKTSRQWLFRVAAVVLMPLLLLALLEMGLRLAGYGYSTALFKKVRLNDRDYLINNEDFGLRFFSPALCQWTLPIKMEPVKPAGAYRVFIFGESAAQGDPEPPFGASRYLGALLREKYPGVNFEVVNLGMVAVSSHVIVPIARDCAHYQGDLWIIYMGNNEMIGPFGAATVFGAKALPWPMVRLDLALQETRVGQLLMNLGLKLKGNSAAPRIWKGLELFLGNELAPGDARKEVVYKNFQRNLRDIVRAGRDSGAAVLLSTVAVNLKDCPPFASLASSNLPPAEREKFDHLLTDGREAETNGNWTSAAADFAEAVTLDPQMAEAQYREGECLLLLNETNEAAQHFQKACDCDELVFRADSRINGIIRETGGQMAGPDLSLCDAAAELPEPGAIAGEETFYEHVHFNFDGNYRLALLWAGQAERLLPGYNKNKARGGWASQEVCEARLGLTDWNRCDVFNQVLQRMEAPPLNSQFNNTQRMAQFADRIKTMVGERNTATAEAALALYTDALARAPGDYMLHQNYAGFLEQIGNFQQAALEWKEAGDLAPINPFAHLCEGECWVKQGDFAAARQSFQEAVTLYPDFAEVWCELGNLDAFEGKWDEALTKYRHSEDLKPNSSQTAVYIGEAEAQLKRFDESVKELRRALDLNPLNWEANYALGGIFNVQGRAEDAKEQFQQVVRLQPGFVKGHLSLGSALLSLHDPDGARQQFIETLRLDPNNKLAQDYLTAATK